VAEGVLGRIAESKRADLERRFDGVSLDALRSKAQPTRRSLGAVLAQPGSRFILEIKKASPSRGSINPNADAGAVARAYAGVADAVSVLTDGPFFGGSNDDLKAARCNFDGPILAKDFFIDRRQVVEARIAGADAVLVMLSLLDDESAKAIIAEAERLGMDALVEVHDEAEMRRANALGAAIIGINNRDLRDLSIDLRTTERLAHMARSPLLVSESGIESRADVERLASRVDAFLVGSALMRSQSPALAARKLVFGRVKLCGVTRAEDLTAGRAAAFAGFIFVPGTPRNLTPEGAAPLAGEARKSGMRPVGVFRDAPVRVVADIATLLNLHAVQLHGDEDRDYIKALRREVKCEIWAAVTPRRGAILSRPGDRLLFDSGRGGTGRTFDWDLVSRHPDLQRSLVAGGIGPANARAAARLGAYAIDVGSSTDAVPGVKSPEKIRALFESLRPQSRQENRLCA
jgi:indole-3-glycerol phosphate synthase/phosphoribosylanthranilate isomerase